MTEQEWLAAENPCMMALFLRKLGTDSRLVSHLTGKAMLRKVQLFVCAACRRDWHDLDDERQRRAVEVAERHADGRANKAELQKAKQGAEDANSGGYRRDKPVRYLVVEATRVAGEKDWNALSREATLDLLRCVFGNPFQPMILNPEWQTPTVASLAQATYEERILPAGELDPQRLAVLSDALEEAGCDDHVILDHLRLLGPHVRGCWALDLILGKR